MPAKKPVEKTITNDAGEQIRHLANGDKHLVPAHTVRGRILESHAALREEHRQLTEVKHQRVAAKKDRQNRKGWPPEKSPV